MFNFSQMFNFRNIPIWGRPAMPVQQGPITIQRPIGGPVLPIMTRNGFPSPSVGSFLPPSNGGAYTSNAFSFGGAASMPRPTPIISSPVGPRF